MTLEGLHPDHTRLVTSLPGVRPRAMLERSGRPAEELRLRADTLWIDTDRGVCTMTWRGAVPLAHAGETGRVVVTEDSVGTLGGRIEATERGGDQGTGTVFGLLDAIQNPTLPFLRSSDGGERERSERAPVADGGTAVLCCRCYRGAAAARRRARARS